MGGTRKEDKKVERTKTKGTESKIYHKQGTRTEFGIIKIENDLHAVARTLEYNIPLRLTLPDLMIEKGNHELVFCCCTDSQERHVREM